MPKMHQVESINNAENLFNEALDLYIKDDYKHADEKLVSAYKIFLADKNTAMVSVCLSFSGLFKYLCKKESYYKSLLLLEDAKFLAESSSDKSAVSINKFAFGCIYFFEHKYQDAQYYLSCALDELDLYPAIKLKTIDYLEQIKTCNTIDRTKPDKDQNATLLIALSKIARTVNAQEANLDNLLNTIAEQTKLVLNADRCTVFLYDKAKNELWSKVALGMNSEEIRFKADKGFAGHVLKTGETIIIKDAYKDERFNKDIDKHTGYKTYNLLCMPIRNIKYEIIGVFQVLNKKDGDFTSADEDLLLAIGTNAGIAIENSMLFNIQQNMIFEQKLLFAGFIDTLAASIEARDKITLGHSNRVRQYSELICNKLGYNKDETEIILKAATLHDIGKIGIKDSVLQKKGALTKEEYEHIKEHAKLTYDILKKTNINKSFAEIAEIASSHHEKFDGTGYFRGLKGEQIPFGGRILAVSDVFDAITSVRHYRDRMPMKEALNIINEGRGKHFDPKIVDIFFSLPCDEIMDVLISEYGIKLKEKDRKFLSGYNLLSFFNILQKNDFSQSDKKIINIFDSYYLRKNETAVNNE